MIDDPVYIVAAARTPIGAFQGGLRSLSAPQLGAEVIRAVLTRGKVDPTWVEETFLGQVLTAGAGQAPARQAARYAGIPDSVPATTVGKVCGSGLQAILFGARAIRLGEAEVVLAGGMESMSQAPYLVPQARQGARLGHGSLVDSLVHDGLWDPYHDFHMANAAERCARAQGISRVDQDRFARTSYERALHAQQSGAFDAELVPVEVATRRGSEHVTQDEEPGRARLEQLESLAPVFEQGGTITAGNASKLNDGSAAVLLASERAVARYGLVPLARVVAYAGHAGPPEAFPTAPVEAMGRALGRAGWTAGDVDLFEINEAFSVVALACTHLAGIEPARVNVHGGAVALGHPIGASGARVVVTLLHAMRTRRVRRGLASLCIGGGEALALLVERVDRGAGG